MLFFFFFLFVHLFVRLPIMDAIIFFFSHQDHFAHIERENRKLLIQMSNIMLRLKEKNPGSHVHSLNLPSRQRDIKRINHDNRLLLERIEKTQPYCEYWSSRVQMFSVPFPQNLPSLQQLFNTHVSHTHV